MRKKLLLTASIKTNTFLCPREDLEAVFMMVYEGNTWAIVLLRRHLLSQPFSLSSLRRVKVPYQLDSILKESCFVRSPHY